MRKFSIPSAILYISGCEENKTAPTFRSQRTSLGKRNLTRSCLCYSKPVSSAQV